MSTATFSEQLGQLWRTRPVRLPRQGPLAGVAAGIGHRYQVDPVLVRVAFVVSTLFGGSGIVLYLAAWLLLARAGDTASPAESLLGRGHSSDSGSRTTVLVVAFLIAVSTLGPLGVGLGGSGLISMALMLGGLWLLHQRHPQPPAVPAGADPWFGIAPPPTGFAGGYTPTPGVFATLPTEYRPSATEPPAATGPVGAAATSCAPSGPGAPRADSLTHTATFAPTAAQSGTPPAWDPLGVAPFAWDLPAPAPAPSSLVPPPARPRSRLTSVVLGLAILAAVAAWAIGVGTGWDAMSPGRIGAVALAVIGVGLVVGAFARRGYGLLVVTGPLIGFVVLASLVGPIDWNSENVGSRVWAPTSEAEIAPEYTTQVGEFVLDLRGVTLTEDKTVDVDAGVGTFTVRIPESMNVITHCSVALGDVRCPDGLSEGTDGSGAPVLTLTMDGRIGDLEVHRG